MAALRVVYEVNDGAPRTYKEEVSIPQLNDGEILGKILAATICGSDLHTLCGKREEAFPSVLGHEGVIEIIESRRPACELRAGDRATFHIADCCKNCTLCKNGVQQKCKQLFKVNIVHLVYKQRLTIIDMCLVV